jgi:hypothetical protein
MGKKLSILTLPLHKVNKMNANMIYRVRQSVGPQHPIQWVPGTLSLGVKRPGREADHSPPYSAEVKKCVERYFHSPTTPPWRGA